MIKAPRPLGENQTFEKFAEYVDLLEVAREFLKGGSAKVRLSLIILDNLAELLMLRACEERFHHDEFWAYVVPPAHSRKEQEASYFFSNKVALLHQADILSDEEAVLLPVAHKYRNTAFHDGSHRDATATAFTLVLFDPCLNLLKHLFGGVSEGGDFGSKADFLSRYDLSTEYISYDEAIGVIADVLKAGLDITPAFVGHILQSDLIAHVEEIETMISEQLHGPTAKHLDEILKAEEFAVHFDDEAASSRLRELRYKISSGNGHEVDRSEYQKAAEKYEVSVKAALDSFTPTLSSEGLRVLKSQAVEFRGGESIQEIMREYLRFDGELDKYENVVRNAAYRLDLEIQTQIDIARGK